MGTRPSAPYLAQRLRTLALTSPTTTGLFYAQLYRAFCPPTDAEHDSLHVLALCLLASGEAYRALHVVRDRADADVSADDDVLDNTARTPGCYGCAVIVAKCCDKLSRFSEGEAVLERAIRRSVPMTLPVVSPAETSATGSLLLARLSNKGKAPSTAQEQYTRALAEDPWLWEAFTGLCDMGCAPSPDVVFPDPPSFSRAPSQRTTRNATLSPGPMPRSSASEVPNFLSRRQLSPIAAAPPVMSGFFTPDVGAAAAPPRIGMLGNPSSWDTPSVMGDTTFPTIDPSAANGTRRPLPNLLSSMIPSALRSTPNPGDAPPSKPPAMKRPRGANVTRKYIETPTNGPLSNESRLNGRDLRSLEQNGDKLIEPPVRRSSRLNTSTKTSSRLNREKRSTRSQSVASSASGHGGETTATLGQEAAQQAQVDDWLRDVVRRCGKAYRNFSLYQCEDAIRDLDALPVEMRQTPWALDMLARCFYEMSNYVKGRRAFKALLEIDPYRLESMEYYSTMLWHMNEPVALSNLSQVLMSVDREAPQAWIAAGNCFSLKQNHDEALRCFRRAAQVAPDFAYAWTLCGHEALQMEEFDRAIAFYRSSVRADPRLYTAWYGLGTVYLRLGKTRHAEHHLRRAAEMNPSNQALLCCMATVLEKMDNFPAALAVLERAAQQGGDDVMVQYERCRILVALGRISEAIAGLEPLSRKSSEEANVHMLLGKCYLRDKRNTAAVHAFTAARELNPKLEAAIRTTMLAYGLDMDDEGGHESLSASPGFAP